MRMSSDGRDTLTGLPGREEARLEMDRRLAQGRLFAIGLLDIDFFYNICAQVGREEGDGILHRLASLLTQQTGGWAYRYGGDEFLLLIEGNAEGGSADFFNALRRRVARAGLVTLSPYDKVPIRTSIGVACAQEGSDGFALLKTAEIALQSAKKMGRYRVEIFKAQGLQCRTQGRLHTLVGHALRGDCAEGVPAFDASLAEPYGVEFAGDCLLIVDRSNHRIRQVREGVVATLCGTGVGGFSGDGGPATRARLCKPSGAAVLPGGDRIYLADTGNHRIRVIDHGVITTLCGTGVGGFSGDGGRGEDARLNRPGGVAVDRQGNVYTNDYGNNRIRRIDSRGVVSTVAGCGEYGYRGDGGQAVQACLDRPYGLCVAPGGDLLFIADYGNHCIRRVELSTGVIATICGTGRPGYSGDGGPGRLASLNAPYWVALWKEDVLLIADAGNHCIRAMNLSSGLVKTVCGSGEPGYVDSDDPSRMRLRIPAGMAVRHNELIIADYGNNAIRRYLLRPGDLPQ